MFHFFVPLIKKSKKIDFVQELSKIGKVRDAALNNLKELTKSRESLLELITQFGCKKFRLVHH